MAEKSFTFNWDILATTAIDGAVAVTEADDTVVATGVLSIAATSSVTFADDTVAATGVLSIAATVAVTEADDTVAATGSLSIAGTVTAAEADDTVAASADLPLTALRLSGGAANADPAASIGGAISSNAPPVGLLADALTSGSTNYRCVYVVNTSAGALPAVGAWIGSQTPSPGSSVEIGVGAAAAGATESAIANQSTAPAGVTFSAATDTAMVNVGALTAGQARALWIKRIVSAGAGVYDDDGFTLAVGDYVSSIPAGAQVYYVSTTGSDANNGSTEALAVQTIGRAQVLWRASRATWSAGSVGCYVIVLPGRHEWTSALALTPSDSGGTNAPLVIRGVLGSGSARSTKVTAAKLLSSFTRTTVAGRSDLAKFTVTGLTASSVVAVQGEALNEARWPKTGFATVNGTNPVTLTGAGTVPTIPGGKGFKFGSFAAADWLFDIVDATQSGANFTLGAASRNGCRACIYNAYEFLDLATEYTREGSDIFVKTAVADDPTAEVGITTSLVTGVDGVSHVRIEQISFASSTGTCLDLDWCDDIKVTDCEVKNTGGWGAVVAGSNSGFEDSAFRNIGCGGVVLYGGDRASLASAGNFMRTNWIDNFSILVRSYTPGIRFDGGVGGVCDGNFIRGSDHVGLMWSGNNHSITYNEVGEVVRTAGDMGAIYSGRDWTYRGNVLKFNIVYDVPGPGAGGARAFYLDDMYSSALVENNIVVNTSRAMFVGGGRDNIIQKNVLFSCNPGFYFDARGKGEPAGWTDPTTMDATLAAVPYTTPPWSTAYPTLATIMSNDRMAPLGNVMANNVMVDSNGSIEYSGSVAQSYLANSTGQSVTVSTWSGPAQPAWFDLVRPQVAAIDTFFPWTTFLAKRARAAAANRP